MKGLGDLCIQHNHNKITVLSHDSGGSFVLAYLVKALEIPCNFCLEGPALNIYKTILGNISLISFDQALSSSTLFLTSTSWDSNLEISAVSHAKKNNILTASVLDHWVNYVERFTLDSILHLPDYIVTLDSYAHQLACNSFPGASIIYERNYYYESLRSDYNVLTRKLAFKPSTLLYVTEPSSAHYTKQKHNPSHLWFDEFSCLRFFLDHLGALPCAFTNIRLRPHPSESPLKYTSIVNEYPGLNIVISQSTTLLDDLSQSVCVVGAETSVLALSSFIGLPTYSSLPPCAHTCRVPHSSIVHLRDLT